MLSQGRRHNAALLSLILATSFLSPAPSCPALVVGSIACSGCFRGPSLSTETQLTAPLSKCWSGAFACGFHGRGGSSTPGSRCRGGRSGSKGAQPRGMCLALRGGAAVDYRHPSFGLAGPSSQGTGKRPHHLVEPHRQPAEEQAGPGGPRLPGALGDTGKQRRMGAGGDGGTHGATQVGNRAAAIIAAKGLVLTCGVIGA